MAEGKVKWFSDRKGYGFITANDTSQDIFVHTTALSEGLVTLSEGDEVLAYVLRPEDQDGNLLLSLNMARQEQSWQRAQELANSSEVWEGEVIGYNKGGLVVPVDDIRGFVPASQVPGFPQGLSQEDRLQRLADMVGAELHVKVIEINRRKRRLILSAAAAQRLWRKQQRERLLSELREGEVRKGYVSSLCSFGAFVDLGVHRDGLVHISELADRFVKRPSEVVKVHQRVTVTVIGIDAQRNRISLSLRRSRRLPDRRQERAAAPSSGLSRSGRSRRARRRR